jgi:AcrR family transcriptional regulator
MSQKTTDRRIQRTRRLLHKALMSVFKYKTITVQEILDHADVGRSTFYTHFQRKDELLISGFENVKALLKSAQDVFSLAMFEHAYEYRAVNRALLGSSAEAIVRRQVHSALVGVIGQEVKIAMQRRKRESGPVTADLLTHFLVSTYISVLTWWLHARNPIPAKEIDEAYRQLVLPSLASIFG